MLSKKIGKFLTTVFDKAEHELLHFDEPSTHIEKIKSEYDGAKKERLEQRKLNRRKSQWE